MSDEDHGWYHCGRCDALFKSAIGESDDRVCTTCGQDPSLGVQTPDVKPVTASTSPATFGNFQAPVMAAPLVHKEFKRHKKIPPMVKWVSGWMAFLALTVVAVRLLFPDDSVNHKPVLKQNFSTEMSYEDQEFLNNHYTECLNSLAGFLAATTPEEQTQFVYSPVNAAGRIARFYEMNQRPKIDFNSMQRKEIAVLKMGGDKAIEMQWETEDGLLLDTVFRREGKDWRLDWENFARYSDSPWALFLTGTDPAEEEFRVLARERLAEEKSTTPELSLALYSPYFGRPARVSAASPEMIVQRDSDDGRLIIAAFQLAKEAKRPFSALTWSDPEGMIRLRIKVRRTQSDEEGRRFEIVKVSACHWLSSDDPGIIPAEKTQSFEAK